MRARARSLGRPGPPADAVAWAGLNCALYYKNTDFRKNVSLVPTSAITGEGLPDLLMLLVQLTQSMMSERLQYISELQCTVLEVGPAIGDAPTRRRSW